MDSEPAYLILTNHQEELHQDDIEEGDDDYYISDYNGRQPSLDTSRAMAVKAPTSGGDDEETDTDNNVSGSGSGGEGHEDEDECVSANSGPSMLIIKSSQGQCDLNEMMSNQKRASRRDRFLIEQFIKNNKNESQMMAAKVKQHNQDHKDSHDDLLGVCQKNHLKNYYCLNHLCEGASAANGTHLVGGEDPDQPSENINEEHATADEDLIQFSDQDLSVEPPGLSQAIDMKQSSDLVDETSSLLNCSTKTSTYTNLYTSLLRSSTNLKDAQVTEGAQTNKPKSLFDSIHNLKDLISSDLEQYNSKVNQAKDFTGMKNTDSLILYNQLNNPDKGPGQNQPLPANYVKQYSETLICGENKDENKEQSAKVQQGSKTVETGSRVSLQRKISELSANGSNMNLIVDKFEDYLKLRNQNTRIKLENQFSLLGDCKFMNDIKIYDKKCPKNQLNPRNLFFQITPLNYTDGYGEDYHQNCDLMIEDYQDYDLNTFNNIENYLNEQQTLNEQQQQQQQQPENLDMQQESDQGFNNDYANEDKDQDNDNYGLFNYQGLSADCETPRPQTSRDSPYSTTKNTKNNVNTNKNLKDMNNQMNHQINKKTTHPPNQMSQSKNQTPQEDMELSSSLNKACPTPGNQFRLSGKRSQFGLESFINSSETLVRLNENLQNYKKSLSEQPYEVTPSALQVPSPLSKPSPSNSESSMMRRGLKVSYSSRHKLKKRRKAQLNIKNELKKLLEFLNQNPKATTSSSLGNKKHNGSTESLNLSSKISDNLKNIHQQLNQTTPRGGGGGGAGKRKLKTDEDVKTSDICLELKNNLRKAIHCFHQIKKNQKNNSSLQAASKKTPLDFADTLNSLKTIQNHVKYYKAIPITLNQLNDIQSSMKREAGKTGRATPPPPPPPLQSNSALPPGYNKKFQKILNLAFDSCKKQSTSSVHRRTYKPNSFHISSQTNLAAARKETQQHQHQQPRRLKRCSSNIKTLVSEYNEKSPPETPMEKPNTATLLPSLSFQKICEKYESFNHKAHDTQMRFNKKFEENFQAIEEKLQTLNRQSLAKVQQQQIPAPPPSPSVYRSTINNLTEINERLLKSLYETTETTATDAFYKNFQPKNPFLMKNDGLNLNRFYMTPNNQQVMQQKQQQEKMALQEMQEQNVKRFQANMENKPKPQQHQPPPPHYHQSVDPQEMGDTCRQQEAAAPTSDEFHLSAISKMSTQTQAELQLQLEKLCQEEKQQQQNRQYELNIEKEFPHTKVDDELRTKDKKSPRKLLKQKSKTEETLQHVLEKKREDWRKVNAEIQASKETKRHGTSKRSTASSFNRHLLKKQLHEELFKQNAAAAAGIELKSKLLTEPKIKALQDLSSEQEQESATLKQWTTKKRLATDNHEVRQAGNPMKLVINPNRLSPIRNPKTFIRNSISYMKSRHQPKTQEPSTTSENITSSSSIVPTTPPPPPSPSRKNATRFWKPKMRSDQFDLRKGRSEILEDMVHRHQKPIPLYENRSKAKKTVGQKGKHRRGEHIEKLTIRYPKPGLKIIKELSQSQQKSEETLVAEDLTPERLKSATSDKTAVNEDFRSPKEENEQLKSQASDTTFQATTSVEATAITHSNEAAKEAEPLLVTISSDEAPMLEPMGASVELVEDQTEVLEPVVEILKPEPIAEPPKPPKPPKPPTPPRMPLFIPVSPKPRILTTAPRETAAIQAKGYDQDAFQLELKQKLEKKKLEYEKAEAKARQEALEVKNTPSDAGNIPKRVSFREIYEEQKQKLVEEEKPLKPEAKKNRKTVSVKPSGPILLSSPPSFIRSYRKDAQTEEMEPKASTAHLKPKSVPRTQRELLKATSQFLEDIIKTIDLTAMVEQIISSEFGQSLAFANSNNNSNNNSNSNEKTTMNSILNMQDLAEKSYKCIAYGNSRYFTELFDNTTVHTRYFRQLLEKHFGKDFEALKPFFTKASSTTDDKPRHRKSKHYSRSSSAEPRSSCPSGEYQHDRLMKRSSSVEAPRRANVRDIIKIFDSNATLKGGSKGAATDYTMVRCGLKRTSSKRSRQKPLPTMEGPEWSSLSVKQMALVYEKILVSRRSEDSEAPSKEQQASECLVIKELKRSSSSNNNKMIGAPSLKAAETKQAEKQPKESPVIETVVPAKQKEKSSANQQIQKNSLEHHKLEIKRKLAQKMAANEFIQKRHQEVKTFQNLSHDIKSILKKGHKKTTEADKVIKSGPKKVFYDALEKELVRSFEASKAFALPKATLEQYIKLLLPAPREDSKETKADKQDTENKVKQDQDHDAEEEEQAAEGGDMSSNEAAEDQQPLEWKSLKKPASTTAKMEKPSLLFQKSPEREKLLLQIEDKLKKYIADSNFPAEQKKQMLVSIDEQLKEMKAREAKEKAKAKAAQKDMEKRKKFIKRAMEEKEKSLLKALGPNYIKLENEINLFLQKAKNECLEDDSEELILEIQSEKKATKTKPQTAKEEQEGPKNKPEAGPIAKAKAPNVSINKSDIESFQKIIAFIKTSPFLQKPGPQKLVKEAEKTVKILTQHKETPKKTALAKPAAKTAVKPEPKPLQKSLKDSLDLDDEQLLACHQQLLENSEKNDQEIMDIINDLHNCLGNNRNSFDKNSFNISNTTNAQCTASLSKEEKVRKSKEAFERIFKKVELRILRKLSPNIKNITYDERKNLHDMVKNVKYFCQSKIDSLNLLQLSASSTTLPSLEQEAEDKIIGILYDIVHKCKYDCLISTEKTNSTNSNQDVMKSFQAFIEENLMKLFSTDDKEAASARKVQKTRLALRGSVSEQFNIVFFGNEIIAKYQLLNRTLNEKTKSSNNKHVAMTPNKLVMTDRSETSKVNLKEEKGETNHIRHMVDHLIHLANTKANDHAKPLAAATKANDSNKQANIYSLNDETDTHTTTKTNANAKTPEPSGKAKGGQTSRKDSKQSPQPTQTQTQNQAQTQNQTQTHTQTEDKAKLLKENVKNFSKELLDKLIIAFDKRPRGIKSPVATKDKKQQPQVTNQFSIKNNRICPVLKQDDEETGDEDYHYPQDLKKLLLHNYNKGVGTAKTKAAAEANDNSKKSSSQSPAAAAAATTSAVVKIKPIDVIQKLQNVVTNNNNYSSSSNSNENSVKMPAATTVAQSSGTDLSVCPKLSARTLARDGKYQSKLYLRYLQANKWDEKLKQLAFERDMVRKLKKSKLNDLIDVFRNPVSVDTLKYFRNLTFHVEEDFIFKLLRPRIFFQVAIQAKDKIFNDILEIQLFTETCPRLVLQFVYCCLRNDYKYFNLNRIYYSKWIEGFCPINHQSIMENPLLCFKPNIINHAMSSGILSFPTRCLHYKKSQASETATSLQDTKENEKQLQKQQQLQQTQQQQQQKRDHFLDFTLSLTPLEVPEGLRVCFGVVYKGNSFLKQINTLSEFEQTKMKIVGCGVSNFL